MIADVLVGVTIGVTIRVSFVGFRGTR